MLHRRLVSLSRHGGATGIVCRIFDDSASQRARPCRRSLLCRTACLVRSLPSSWSCRAKESPARSGARWCCGRADRFGDARRRGRASDMQMRARWPAGVGAGFARWRGYRAVTLRGGRIPQDDCTDRRECGVSVCGAPAYAASCARYKLANDGQDTRAVQHYLGHKNIQHTVRYTELSPERFKSF
jgi:Phage integrase family